MAVVAIKEWTNDIVLYERNYRALKALDKDIAVLSSFIVNLRVWRCPRQDGVRTVRPCMHDKRRTMRNVLSVP